VTPDAAAGERWARAQPLRLVHALGAVNGAIERWHARLGNVCAAAVWHRGAEPRQHTAGPLTGCVVHLQE